MLRFFVIAAFGIGFASCSARTETHSDAGRDFARRLCAIQNECGCADHLIIPDCESRVEQEFIASERKALDAGFVYDAGCMETFLGRIDELGACGVEYPDQDPPCAVYSGNADVGEPCDVFDTMPLMYGCRIDLACIEGICRDLDEPVLPLGATCSTEQGDLPMGWLGYCDEGLRCDSQDTLTCVPYSPEPLAPLGEECTVWYGCEGGNVCRPRDDDPQPSEARPGVCVERTPPGEPCTTVYECDRICEAGICQEAPPVLCDILGNWQAIHEDA